jgi:hypothetical protein
MNLPFEDVRHNRVSDIYIKLLRERKFIEAKVNDQKNQMQKEKIESVPIISSFDFTPSSTTSYPLSTPSYALGSDDEIVSPVNDYEYSALAKNVSVPPQGSIIIQPAVSSSVVSYNSIDDVSKKSYEVGNIRHFKEGKQLPSDIDSNILSPFQSLKDSHLFYPPVHIRDSKDYKLATESLDRIKFLLLKKTNSENSSKNEINAQLIPARVPILRYTPLAPFGVRKKRHNNNPNISHPLYSECEGIPSVDINVSSPDGLSSSASIYYFISLMPHIIKPLLFAIKVFFCCCYYCD